MALATNLGYPRIGSKRQLKQATEAFLVGRISTADLEEQGYLIRKANWELQQQLGLDHIPANDFSFYDHVLDTSDMLDAIPSRFNSRRQAGSLARYFTMARGGRTPEGDVSPMEMTKWFDTNYHYIVPEFEPDQTFALANTRPLDRYHEARVLNINTRPVIIGPVTFLGLGKPTPGAGEPLSLLPAVLPVYTELLTRMYDAGVAWVQIDEPLLATDLSPAAQNAYIAAYRHLGELKEKPSILLAAYFSSLGENLPLAMSLPVDGLHLDLVRAPQQLDDALRLAPDRFSLSLGVIDGRNIWRNDLVGSLTILRKAADKLGSDRVMVAPSCSLLHVPLDVALETAIPPEITGWMAFARQKLDEIVLLAGAINNGDQTIEQELKASQGILDSRRRSALVHKKQVIERLKMVSPQMMKRKRSYPQRKARQREKLNLPLFPTTTIGSFPQTSEIRQARAKLVAGEQSSESYREFISAEIERTIRFQEQIGIDVLVHGEFERNDMVQYFGEQLKGFAFTRHGWVQSFGTRYVRPPVIYGDVSRPHPISVHWSQYAQSLTSRPVKGMLTGPITMLQWSFVRDDQPRAQTCRQLALALREEVLDLEAAGVGIIQIDEPALREGLPLRRSEWQEYLSWAVECFRLTSSGVRDETQIHTHMCYAEFEDIIESIAALDADVISIEASRSRMDLLNVFETFHYPNEIGPGVYDIHSPRIPEVDEIQGLIRKALKVLSPAQLWVNPDCGLKTRRWEEVRPALENMVAAARAIRAEIQKAQD